MTEKQPAGQSDQQPQGGQSDQQPQGGQSENPRGGNLWKGRLRRTVHPPDHYQPGMASTQRGGGIVWQTRQSLEDYTHCVTFP